MIQDFCMEQENSSLFDLVVDPETSDFKSVEGMETAFNFQLFVDQRVTRKERNLARSRQGWIGDIETRGEGYQVGSILHLQSQSRDIPLNNNETAEYAKNALGYFVAIGAAKEVDAVVVGKNIEGEINVDGNEVNRYSRLWRSTTEDCKPNIRPLAKTSVDNALSDIREQILTDINENLTAFTKRRP